MGKKIKRWYRPVIQSGWEKNMSQETRRAKLLQAHKGDNLASARAMQSLSNVTEDEETAKKARFDALYFFEQHRISRAKFRHNGKGLNLTPRMKRLPR